MAVTAADPRNTGDFHHQELRIMDLVEYRILPATEVAGGAVHPNQAGVRT
ncbi:MAG: hypothetical protein JSV86_19380 [Gemmatimonadota bacterium]|nr:MAG: hypothetical protein JSV86_19380 [Gemmatimonadota bacterium]